MPTQTPPGLAAVRKAGQKFARRQAARDEARDELLEEIRTAYRAGAQPKELIEASGLARQTVFDAIKKPAEAGPGDLPQTVSYP